LSESEIIDVADLPLASSPLRSIISKYGQYNYPSLKELDISYIKWVLEKTKGNKQMAAKILEIDRKTISRLLAKAADEE
jgi:DNA-binding NtrC family response regulator